MLYRGLVSSDFKLSKEDFSSTLLALMKNVIMVNDDLYDTNKPSSSSPSLLPCNDFFGVQDFNSDSSLLSNSVHIVLDVTNDKIDKAQELLSPHQVSIIG